MAYGDLKDLAKETAPDKVLRGKVFKKLHAMQNMIDITEVLVLWFINFLIKSLQVVVLKMKLHNISN